MQTTVIVANENLIDLLIRLEEYMIDRADTDLDGDSMRPNKEMQFLCEIKEALDQLEKHGWNPSDDQDELTENN